MLQADSTVKQVDMSERPSALNATDAIRMIRQGELTPDALLESCIAQIEQVDPVVNAMITRVYDRAREQAQLATQAANRGDELGPLHGLPIAIKDIQATRYPHNLWLCGLCGQHSRSGCRHCAAYS